MFTPEGYWSWSETVDAASDWTLAIVAATLAPELSTDSIERGSYKVEELLFERLVSGGWAQDLNEAKFGLDLMKLWVLANYLDTYDAVLCSPDGKTLRCPPLLKAHGDAFDWWIWPLDNKNLATGEAHNYFEAFRLGKFHITDALARFCAIDFDTGTIRLKPNTVSLLSSASYGHNFENHKEAMRFIDEQIRPVVGWSVCWNDKEVPKTMEELFADLGFADLAGSAVSKGGTDQPPSKKLGLHILECALEAFPDGKGSATWQDVEVKVGYSRRSIVRALKQNGLHATWAGNGHRQ